MSTAVIFGVGAIVFAITVYGVVLSGGILLTRRFYEQNDAYTERPGFENAGPGRPKESDT